MCTRAYGNRMGSEISNSSNRVYSTYIYLCMYIHYEMHFSQLNWQTFSNLNAVRSNIVRQTFCGIPYMRNVISDLDLGMRISIRTFNAISLNWFMTVERSSAQHNQIHSLFNHFYFSFYDYTFSFSIYLFVCLFHTFHRFRLPSVLISICFYYSVRIHLLL